jgi:hypothetical protein
VDLLVNSEMEGRPAKSSKAINARIQIESKLQAMRGSNPHCNPVPELRESVIAATLIPFGNDKQEEDYYRRTSAQPFAYCGGCGEFDMMPGLRCAR